MLQKKQKNYKNSKTKFIPISVVCTAIEKIFRQTLSTTCPETVSRQKLNHSPLVKSKINHTIHTNVQQQKK